MFRYFRHAWAQGLRSRNQIWISVLSWAVLRLFTFVEMLHLVMDETEVTSSSFPIVAVTITSTPWLLVFNVTPYQDKNKSRSIDKVQNLEKWRR